MIRKVKIRNFKCFRDFEIDLGPFNVLIGPNDSGKTAFLETIRLATALTPKGNAQASTLAKQLGITLGAESVWRQEKGSEIQIAAELGSQNEPRQILQVTSTSGENVFVFTSDLVGEPAVPEHLPPDWKREYFFSEVGKASYYRFDPRALKKASELRENPFEMGQDGSGLPTFLNGIWGKNRDAFLDLEREFYSRFPEYRHFEILPERTPGGEVGQALKFHTRHGEELSADSVSDGAFLSLAFLALCYQPDPPRTLLVEEPENGVHHARLKEIVNTLRGLCEKKQGQVQVVMTTHSPYLLDCIQPEEVRVFSKDEQGAIQAARLSDHPDVEDFKKHFKTGEIWAGFDDEGDIVFPEGVSK